MKKKLLLLVILILPSISFSSRLLFEKRYILTTLASNKPLLLTLKNLLTRGKIINVGARVNNDGIQWIKFFYPGYGYLFIPERFTITVSNNSRELANILKDDFDLVSINNSFKLPYNYKPDDLVKLDVFYLKNQPVYLRKEVAYAFFNMAYNAKLEGIDISAVKGYTSSDELALKLHEKYQIYKAQEYFPYDVEYPTTSIMQTGLAVDITSTNVNNKLEYNFYFSNEYKWLIDNGHIYGFFPIGGSDNETTFKPYRFRYYKNSFNAESKNESPEYNTIDLYGIAKLIVRKKGNIALTCFKIHDDETTASRILSYIFKKYGGTSIELINTNSLNSRNIEIKVNKKTYSIDPNRIFTDEGIKKMRMFNGHLNSEELEISEKKVKLIRNKILEVLSLNENTPFIYIHTNRFYSVLSVEYLKQISKRANDVFTIHRNKSYHPKLFVYVINNKDYNYFLKQNINVILQKRAIDIDDGSLSIYSQIFIPNLSYATLETINEDPIALRYIADIAVEYFLQKHRK